jgi:hypothetical protein
MPSGPNKPWDEEFESIFGNSWFWKVKLPCYHGIIITAVGTQSSRGFENQVYLKQKRIVIQGFHGTKNCGRV